MTPKVFKHAQVIVVVQLSVLACIVIFTYLSFSGPLETLLPTRLEPDLEPESTCPHTYKIIQPKDCYTFDSKRLCSSDINIFTLTSNATVSRNVDGPFPLWTQLQARANVNMYIPQPSDRAPTAISVNVSERTDNLISEFSLEALKRAYMDDPTKKWYLKFDDDGYLFFPNFMAVLAKLDPSLNVIGGKFFSRYHVSGGAGYFMSNSVIKKIAENADECPPGDGNEDLRFVDCARKFFPESLELVNVKGMYPFNVQLTVENFYNGSPEGLVEFPVSFHWIKSRAESQAIHDCRQIIH